jgi:hypothetical protein
MSEYVTYKCPQCGHSESRRCLIYCWECGAVSLDIRDARLSELEVQLGAAIPKVAELHGRIRDLEAALREVPPLIRSSSKLIGTVRAMHPSAFCDFGDDLHAWADSAQSLLDRTEALLAAPAGEAGGTHHPCENCGSALSLLRLCTRQYCDHCADHCRHESPCNGASDCELHEHEAGGEAK